MQRVAGKDATKEFRKFHDVQQVLHRYGKELYVGEVGSNKDNQEKEEKKEESNSFGDLVPYGDPNWYQGYTSPFFNDSHKQFRYCLFILFSPLIFSYS